MPFANSASRIDFQSHSPTSVRTHSRTSIVPHGRPEETYLKAKEACTQHAQDCAGNRDPEVSALPGDEAAAPRLRRVRVLRRQAAGCGQGSVTLARIALDAMGGDFAPRATVAGALLALGELDSAHSIQLVGRTPPITEQLDALLNDGEFALLRPHRSRIGVIEATDVIEMTDKPGSAIRGTPKR